jgi:Asp-tRNA(Asn)/Glu-tRNA(Gln) amidotransferase A subunit family amidase
MTPALPPADLTATRAALHAGRTTLQAELERAAAVAASPACERVFLGPATHRREGVRSAPSLPLAGLPVSVKDLFDVAGQVTAAGSTVLADAPPARQHSAVVARMLAAGGTLAGRTNMTEFAFSGVGTNPHFGTPCNPADPAVARIPGGSSSGAAVSVATGAAFIGLGSDTGGSIRIPAALCGIVGFKNTARLTPLDGALPLSTTLDTACALTRSVRDAILAHEILAQRLVSRSPVALAGYRLAVARTTMLDQLDEHVASAFDAALGRLRQAGARIEEIPLEAIRDLGTLQVNGGFAAPESYAWHRRLIDERGAGYDPRVRTRIQRGESMKAHEYLQLVRERADWMERVRLALRGFDAVLSPTVPIVAPSIDTVAPADGRDAAVDQARDAEFFRVNALLLRNTSVVNMLDGCAISIPCQRPGELPVGLMIWQSALRDDTVLNIAVQAEAALSLQPRAA